MAFDRVTLIAHADWSVNPKKRWMAAAAKQSDQSWLVYNPALLYEQSELFSRISSLQKQPGCIIIGFDFPIGLPARYAALVEITDFLSALPSFGYGKWEDFYHPALNASEINLYRPFYPMKSGEYKRYDLERGLKLPFSDLYRLCEKGSIYRRAACPLFWTLGPQQVGKAAIDGWKSIIVPALDGSNPDLKIWPFSGSLLHCCQPDSIVFVETYPAEYYAHLGLFSVHKRFSKRDQNDRKGLAEILLSTAKMLRLNHDDSTIALIRDGFGSHRWGEDQFDALVGLYGMINIVQGNYPFSEPSSSQVIKLEGWIFGQLIPEGV